MDGYFLAVYKELFGLGLKSVDLLIISQVYEYQRKDMNCYVTNEQLSKWFGESVSTIERSIKKLTNLNIIEKKTTFIKGLKGKADKKAGNRQREMKLNPRGLWDVEVIDDSWNRHYEGSNSSSNPHIEGSNSSWNRHNDVTIDKSVNKTVSIKEKQSTDDADADLGSEVSTCSTKNSKTLKKYKSPEDLPSDILREILEGLEEYIASGRTRGLNYKDVARKYEIKQEYLDKGIIKWIKTILFNREQSEMIMNDSSSDSVEDFDDDDSNVDSLKFLITPEQAREIKKTLDSFDESENLKRMQYKLTRIPRDYGIPKSIVDRFDFEEQLENIAA